MQSLPCHSRMRKRVKRSQVQLKCRLVGVEVVLDGPESENGAGKRSQNRSYKEARVLVLLRTSKKELGLSVERLQVRLKEGSLM